MIKHIEEHILFLDLLIIGFFFLIYYYNQSISMFFLWTTFIVIMKYKTSIGWDNTLIRWGRSVR